MSRAKDELQELGRSLGFEVHYNSHKIWINRDMLGGRFSKCFSYRGECGEALRKSVADWIRVWGVELKVFDSYDGDKNEKRSEMETTKSS